MKKILFIVQAPAGGVSRYLVDIISNMSKDKYQIGIIYNPQYEDERFHDWKAAQRNVSFFELNTLKRELSLFSDARSIFEIMTIIHEFHPDVVHAQSSKAGVVGRIAAKLMHVRKIIYTPHAYAFMSPEFSSNKRNVYMLAEKILSVCCTDMTINCSFSEHEYAMKKKIDKASKFVVIQNAVPLVNTFDSQAQHQRLGVKDTKLVVANFARVSPQKNPELFIRIATKVKSLDSNIEFLWIGTNASGMTAESVRFLGEMSNAQMLMSGVNLILSTSYFEGLSYSLLEAASVGVRVLASNVPGNDEFIRGYALGDNFELDDSIDAIAKKVIRILRDKTPGNLGQKQDSFQNMLRNTLKLYD